MREYLHGCAYFPGTGPKNHRCGGCRHFMEVRGTASGKRLKNGRCLLWVEFKGRGDLAEAARRGNFVARADVRWVAPVVPRATSACKEFDDARQ